MIKKYIYCISSISICSSIHAGGTRGTIHYPELRISLSWQCNEINKNFTFNKSNTANITLSEKIISELEERSNVVAIFNARKDKIDDCFKNKSLDTAEILINSINNTYWKQITKFLEGKGLVIVNASFIFSDNGKEVGLDTILKNSEEGKTISLNITLHCREINNNNATPIKSNAATGTSKTSGPDNNTSTITITPHIGYNPVDNSVISPNKVHNSKTITNNVNPNIVDQDNGMPNTFGNGLSNTPFLDINITPTSSIQVGSTPKGPKKDYKAGSGSNQLNASKGCCLCKKR